jgi:predicted PurR-regulated permease PerM
MRDVFAKHIRSMGIAARLLSAALVLGFLYYGQPVLVPLALALLVAFALHPVVRRLMQWRLPRGVSVGITVGAFVLILLGLSWFIGGQLMSFAEELPSYRQNLIQKANEARAMFSGGALDQVRATVQEVSGESATAPSTAPQAAESSTFSSWLESAGMVTDPLTTLGLVILLVAMMLLQWGELRGRFLGMISGNVTHTTSALADAGSRVGKYLFLQFLYNTGFGIVVGIALMLLGVPYAALWGLCAALFRYLPYVGPLFAALLPLAVSLVTSSGWGQVFSVGVLFLVLELVSNNFIEPWLYGSKLGVSEIGIIMASVAWTYLWGPVGLLLATPLTVCLVVLGEHVRGLSFFARLLGTEKTLTDAQFIYQRLLAGDSLEASQLTRDHIRRDGSERFVSDVLLPALAHARHDEVARQLDDEARAGVLDEIRVVCEEMPEAETPAAKPGAGSSRQVVLWSACPFTDAALPAFQNDLQMPAGALEVIKSTELTGDALQRLAALDEKPAAISVTHLSEVDTPRVNGLLKRLARLLPGVPVQVARLGGAVFASEEREALIAAGASVFATSLSEARAWMQAYAASSVPAA